MPTLAFADANVLLDAILNRFPNGEDCQAIMDLANSSRLQLYTSSSCVLMMMYFLKKDSMSAKEIIAIVSKLLLFISLISPSKDTFKIALYAGFSDLEDAVQYYTALDVKGMDYFITSNIKDFKAAKESLPVVTPKQFIAAYNRH